MQLTENLSKNALEKYFEPYRNNIIGIDQKFQSPYGLQTILYADWIASGRMYEPIENLFRNKISPFVGNTHTETTVTGCAMTYAYHQSKEIIKTHVNASDEDVIISGNSGMTGVINKFQRILGLRVHEKYRDQIIESLDEKPLVIITHMEHHSNQTTWLETTADLEIINPCPNGKVDMNHFEEILEKHKNRKLKIAAITSCSNVTGVFTPYHDIAKRMHQEGGLCFVDFACAAPYIDIDMHPEDPLAYLDAIYFSPHKFLGGPSSTGILIFNKKLYDNKIPDNPGGGTVDWTNPWGGHKYYEEIEAREDGGTPAFLQTMRVAFCIQLKEKMGVNKMLKREHELLERIWPSLDQIDNLIILAENLRDRLGVISFYIQDLHYNLAVKLLNDKFGIQVRGGCSCAGTYGHYLLQVSEEYSKNITDKINSGDLSSKPGWIRLSLHPTMTNEDLDNIVDALKQLCLNHEEWAKDYCYDLKSNEYKHLDGGCIESELSQYWFNQDLI